MLIANPTYDIVFKKLMEDLNIARGILELILATTIEQIEFASQEFTASREDLSLTYFRLDFKARIKTPDGAKNVLIEMQKGKLSTDIDRFRAYLAEEYRRLCEVRDAHGEVQRLGLPIITIYFFGYSIDARLPGAFKIDRRYLDLITGEELPVRCDVMERLTHDAYAVQIPRLNNQHRSAVEELLAIFRQDHYGDEAGHTLIVEGDSSKYALITDILHNLTRLVESPEVQRSMAIEDEMYAALAGGIAEKTRELNIAKREAERGRLEEKRKREEAERGREEEQRKREEAERGREEEQRKREEAEREREEEQRKREDAERKIAAAEAEIKRLRAL